MIGDRSSWQAFCHLVVFLVIVDGALAGFASAEDFGDPGGLAAPLVARGVLDGLRPPTLDPSAEVKAGGSLAGTGFPTSRLEPRRVQLAHEGGAVVAEGSAQSGPAKPSTSDDGAPMVLVPAGKFWMGLPEGEGERDEHPRRQIALHAFFIDTHEVTTSRYAEFLQETGRDKPQHWDQVDLGRHGNLPVVGVNWHDAKAYCEWAGKRLPAEAEWEKAARGTDGRAYPWGNEIPTPALANYAKAWSPNTVYKERLEDVSSDNSGKSPYGLHHMAGNVWEWVADWYDARYYSKGPVRNPQGPSRGKDRVVRGGSWFNQSEHLRSANRYAFAPSNRIATNGMRCARDVEGH